MTNINKTIMNVEYRTITNENKNRHKSMKTTKYK